LGFVKHVAVFEDGTIKQTVNEHPINGDSFNGHWKWETISSIPEKCEWHWQLSRKHVILPGIVPRTSVTTIPRARKT
jgi:hypothetical protein